MSAVADKLREARALIERGWTQGAYKDGDCVCAAGAINAAFTGAANLYGDTAEDGSARDTLATAAEIDPWNITDWNDDPQRTKAEVLAAFDKAIELAEREVA